MSRIACLLSLIGLFSSGLAAAFAAELADKVDASQKIEWRHDLKVAQQQAAATGKPMLIVFGADWCTFCKKYEAQTLGHPTMVSYVNKEFIAVHLDYDKDRKTADTLEVKALPCTVVLSAEADLLGRIAGCKSPQDLWESLEKTKQVQVKIRQARYAAR